MSNDWVSAKIKLPQGNARYKVLVDGIGVRFSDFNTVRKSWDIVGDVISWKEEFDQLKSPPSAKINMDDMLLMNTFDNPEMVALTNLAENEMCRMIGVIKVDIKVYTVAADANITVAGRVLAISESFAAQQTGHDSLVIHEVSRLSKSVKPGDEVTVEYQDGVGDVYPGISKGTVIRVTCDELLRDELSMLESKISEIIDKLIENGTVVTPKVFDMVVKKTIEKVSKLEGWVREPEDVVVKEIKAIDTQAHLLSDRKEHEHDHKI